MEGNTAFALFFFFFSRGVVTYGLETQLLLCEELTESMSMLKWLLYTTKLWMFVTQHSNCNREDVNINESKSGDLVHRQGWIPKTRIKFLRRVKTK